MAKVALLIGVSEYEPGLDALPAAVKDVLAMQQVLLHPEMGGFDAGGVTVLQNPDRQTMETAIYRLFANRQKDDLVLLYFSGHGVLDEGGEFYFATRQTQKEQGRLIPTTAVAARSVQGWMEQSRSQRLVVMLDSCFSGAFARGVKAKDSGSVNLEQYLGGRGRAILTASTSTQYALTQDDLDLSVYTHYLVEGIRTGGADLDDDGFIAVEELHTYASAKVREAAPAMTPEFYPVKEGYKILLAKSPKDDPLLKYRKQVKHLAEEDEGNFSFINRAYLDELRLVSGILTEVAENIEVEELEPYRQRQAKVERYRAVFAGAIAHRYPLSDRDRTALKRLQNLLSLRDEDTATIEAPLLTEAELAFQRKSQQTLSVQVVRQQPELSGRTGEEPSKIQGRSDRPSRVVEIETVTIIGIEKTDSNGKEHTEVLTRNTGARVKVYSENLGGGIGLDMVFIPSGEFRMGTSDAEQSIIIQERIRAGASQEDAEKQTRWEMPQHRVRVPEFWMARFAVTQAQWRQIAGLPEVNIDLDADPSHFKGAKRPVEQLSWEEAVEFCDRLSRQTGKPYRLPSEAEWEYACRATTTTPFHFGETITSELVNCNGSKPYSQAPKSEYREETLDADALPPNGFGLHNMHGNVWEWCADFWHENYEAAPTDGSAWTTGGSSDRRVVRGGSWYNYPVHCRAATRYLFSPGYRNIILGFRVVCSGSPGFF